ncbi:MAG: DinB family protein [Pseudomonadota bacterium]
MRIQQSAEALLDQLSDVVAQLDEPDFSRPVPTLSGASVGQHLRHTIEFFCCVIDGVETGTIDYDLRCRDPALESDPTAALRAIDGIKGFLAGTERDRPLTLRVDYSVEPGNGSEIHSCLFRELAYNIEHAVHHMALIRIGVAEIDPSVALPEHFGVASSTVRYRQAS